MTSVTQPLPFSPGPIKLPPGNLETVDEIPGDSDLEDDRSDAYNSGSDLGLSNIEEEDEDDADGEEGSIRERDAVFEKIKETLSKTQRSESVITDLSSVSDSSDSPQVQISQNYTSVPYGIQPRATYEHSSQHADIMGVAYNGRMRQFVILDSKGITTWKRDVVDPRDMKHLEGKDLTPKTFNLNQVRRALQFPKYEYRLIRNIVYAPKYNCYFALGRDFSVKVLNRDFEETCSVNTDMRSVLYILFNPVRDELITGGVAGIKIWQFQQAAGKAFTELKPLANYELRLKETLPNVGGSWVKKVELDYHLQHLYCCSDTDLHVYDLTGKMLFKFERAHTMSITGCCFSPSAKVLITSSVDSEVKIWSLTGGLVHTFRGHSRAVTGMLLHPETSSIIITCSLDGSIRMWSLDTMDLLYMIVVSADGVMWMGLTDDKLLYISTCRNITLWHLNNFCCFWSLARNPVTNLSTASCEEKTTRVLAVGDDSSVRIFCRSNHRNITTVLPPPDISPLQDVLSVSYSREKNAAFLLITNKEIWVYTTRTDPASRIAIWNVHDLQLPYISGDNSNLPPGFDTLFCYPVTWQVSINPLIRSVVIQPPSQLLACHRATENGNGNEIVSNCCSVCILNSTAMMWTDEGLCCPIRHTYLLLGMEDGRILFMDPVIKGQKYMEFKASKDAIQEMKHDMAHSCLITMCRLKTLVLIQVWGLPQLDAMYEVYCAPDVSGISLVGQSMLTGHVSGHVNLHQLEPVEDQGALKSKQEPPYESVVDDKRRPEHQSPVVAMDSLASLQIFISCSSDGAIKVWEENKVLLTEVMLDKSLSSATFLNDMGDLLVGFKNHVFYIDHTKLCPTFKPPEIEMETSDQESDVYEDPRVLYELIKQDDEPVTLENYLVPYDHLEFDKDFLEGKTRIEQPKTAAEALESSETETETDISLAPSSIYLSPAESIESLSMIDLTLGADYSKYDLRDQMKATLDQIGTRGKKRFKTITIETPAQSDMEEREIEMELEKFSLPLFGESPGGSPCITPPSGQASPRSREHLEDMEQYSDDEGMPKPSGFVPIMPDTAYSSAPSARGSTSTRTLTSESYKQRTLTPSSPTKSQSYLHTSANIEEYSPRVSNQTRKQSALQDFEEYYQTSAVKRSSVAKGQPRKSVDKTGHSHTTGQREDADVTDSETMLSSKRSSEVTLVTHDQRSESEYDSLVSEEIDDKSQTKSRPLSVTTDLSEKESADRDLQSRSGLDLDMQSEADSCTATSDSDTQSPTKTSDNELLLITAISDIDITDKPDEIDKGDLEKSRSSSEGVKAGGTMEAPEAGYGDEEEVDEHGRRVKGSKVDMRGLMKKRRITSGRAPSLTRRSSADHAHDDHDHEHGHDDKRKEIKKKQKEDRKLSIHQQQQQPQQQQRVDISKLANLPPNPPSMLSRKRSLSEQRKNLDLLHRPDNHKQMDPNDPNLAQIHFDQDHTDADQLQEELWASEAAVHGQTLALPPQKDKNKARLMDRPAQIDSRAQRLKDRKHMLGERDSVEGQTPGVGSSPTAELEQEENQMETTEPRETTDKSKDKKVEKSDRTQNDSAQSGDAKTGVSCEATIEGVSDLDTNAPETQMQRTKRLGYKLDSDKVFDSDKKEHTEGTPNVLINRRNRSKLNVYIPQAERESISSARSSRRGTPDSGIDDGVSHQGSQASRISRVKGLGVPDTDEFGDVELPAPDGTLLSEEDKVATRRPASSFTGLRRGQLEGEKLRAERPHTAHVRFKAEDLQTAFQEALQRYQNLPGTPAFVSADTLYRNDGVSFEDNWQDRVIERHTLLRMQKEIRAQSAAQRRQAIETIQKDKHSSKLFTSRCDSAIGGFTNPDSASIQTVRRANTSMSVPINLGYGVHSAPPTARPNTANPALEKQQMIKNELSQEKAFRFRLSKDAPPALPKSRPSSSRSISTVADFSPHWIDPRNPDAWRPKSSRSIPSKCNRYILVNKPKERPSKPVPSPLEEQLLVERFPKMGSKIVQSYVPDLSPRIKKSYNMEYSPFVYQRFV